MQHLLREAAIGQLLNRVSKGKILPYPDQRPDYIVPARYLKGNFDSRAGTLTTATADNTHRPSDGVTLVDAEGAQIKKAESGEDLEKGASNPEVPPSIATYPYLVDWEENDRDNPQ